MGSLIPILTSIIGVVASGPNAKGQAGGIAGALIAGADPLVKAFQMGLLDGAGESFQQLGFAVGAALAGWIVGFIIPWLAPANTPKA